jgi:signal transduction histidine kinase
LSAAFATLMLLFVALVAVQLFVSDRLQTRQQQHADRIGQALIANGQVLQSMTDAETGIRGFQLTGDKVFLSPYDSGRVGAFTAFDRVAALSSDATVQRFLTAERQAAAHWLYAYATPIVNAGVADAGQPRANRGKQMFDDLRTMNAQVDKAIRADRDRVAAADRRRSRIAQLLFASLAAAFIAVALILALVQQRSLFAPLEDIRRTLRRLAQGERSARAVAAGPGEMRAVIGTLNMLAAQTERLLDAESARGVRHELRQAVAAELRSDHSLEVIARNIAELIGTTLGADAVHGRIAIDLDPGPALCVSWPETAPELSSRIVSDVLAGAPGAVLTVPHVSGAVAVPLAGDDETKTGLLYLVRRNNRPWSAEERRVLAAIAREIEHSVRQHRLAHRQARLINELQMLDERKDVFVATVTHELRTPLTSILGYVEMLSDGDGGELSPMQQRGVSAILRNALRLQDTVADLLQLDRTPGAAHAPVDLAALVTDVHAELAGAAQAKELQVDFDLSRAWVTGDGAQLSRAIRNLLDNAIKFTAAGGRIGCSVAADGDDVVLTVSDTGIGIPDADLSGLFTPFHRGANAMRQAVQGSGLGLAIVRNIVTEHGGRVSARSMLDEGSTFTIMLPAAAAPVDVRVAQAEGAVL